MSLPLMSLDLDGVIVTPLLGNRAISRRLVHGPLPERVLLRDPASRGLRRLTHTVLEAAYRLRYGGRRPLPEVSNALNDLAQRRDLVVLTGRGWGSQKVVEAWLARHRLDSFFKAVFWNNTNLRAPKFKLWTARRLGVQEHVDDDGPVAHYLGSNGVPCVFLRDWPRNRGLPYPPQVVVIESLADLSALLTRNGQTP